MFNMSALNSLRSQHRHLFPGVYNDSWYSNNGGGGVSRSESDKDDIASLLRIPGLNAKELW